MHGVVELLPGLPHTILLSLSHIHLVIPLSPRHTNSIHGKILNTNVCVFFSFWKKSASIGHSCDGECEKRRRMCRRDIHHTHTHKLSVVTCHPWHHGGGFFFFFFYWRGYVDAMWGETPMHTAHTHVTDAFTKIFGWLATVHHQMARGRIITRRYRISPRIEEEEEQTRKRKREKTHWFVVISIAGGPIGVERI